MEYVEVSKRIKEAMNDKNISAIELSRLSGVGKAAISHYVNGRYCPHNKNAVMIANVLNVNPTWLMGFDVPKHLNKTNELYPLSADERTLIEAYRSNDATYRKMIEMIIFNYKQSQEGDYNGNS